MKKGFLFGSVILVFLSCKKFVDINPANAAIITTDNVFTSDESATSAVLGLYSKMRLGGNPMTNAGLSLYSSLSADDIVNTTTNATTDPFSKNELLSNNSTLLNGFWRFAYSSIYQTNLILEGLSKSTALTDSVRTQLKGETKVVRALYYFYLANLFGDVPLVTNSDYKINAVLGRASIASLYEQIKNDLLDAQTLLSDRYPISLRARPNKLVAQTLLARVYLFLSDWPKAETMANSVITSNSYSLGAIGSTFLASSPETIWQIVSDKVNTAEGAAFIPFSGTARPTYAITSSLLSSIEAGDLRKVNWMKKVTVNSVDYYYPFKYKQRTITSGATPTEYEIVFRLAELYLIRAEARLNQNNLIGAIADLNIIRNRAGLTPPLANTLTQSQITGYLQHEWQMEFFAEWAHRWLDLKRTGRADAVLSAVKGSTWQQTDILYPIPNAEILLNSFLTQNPGY